MTVGKTKSLNEQWSENIGYEEAKNARGFDG